jgi:hypothetical protein
LNINKNIIFWLGVSYRCARAKNGYASGRHYWEVEIITPLEGAYEGYIYVGVIDGGYHSQTYIGAEKSNDLFALILC